MNNKIRFAFTSLAAAAVVCAAQAATVTLQTGDTAAAATTSFNGTGGWSDGTAPAAGNDYLVNLGDGEGQGIWMPSVTATFAGDSLTLGDATTPGRLDYSTQYIWTFGNLNLVNGKIVFRVTSASNYNSSTPCGFRGTLNVMSALANPFVIECPSGKSFFYHVCANTLQGDATTAICFRDPTPNGGSSINAGAGNQNDGFTSYHGTVILDGITLRVNNFSQFANVAGIILRNNATLVQRANGSGTWNLPDLRVAIDATGGRIQQYGNLTKVCFIADGGPFTRVGGSTINFGGRMSVTAFTNNCSGTTGLLSGANVFCGRIGQVAGTLAIHDGVTFTNAPDSIRVQPVDVTGGTLFAGPVAGARLQVNLAGGAIRPSNGASLSQTAADAVSADILPLTNAVFASGTVLLDYDTVSDTFDKIVFDTTSRMTFSENAPLALSATAQLPDATATNTYTVLEIPVACGVVTPEMFDSEGVYSQSMIPSVVKVATSDGIQRVQVALAIQEAEDYYLTEGDTDFSADTAFTTLPHWTSGGAPARVHHYHVALGTGDGDALHCPGAVGAFPGASLVIGEEGHPGRMDYGTSHTWSFNKLRLVNGKIVFHVTSGSNYNTDSPYGFRGNIEVESTMANPFVIENVSGKNLMYHVCANTLHGDATTAICFRDSNQNRGSAINAGAGMQNDGFTSYNGTVIFDGVTTRVNNFAQFANVAGIILRNNATLVQRGGNASSSWSLASPAITVDATGGCIKPDAGLTSVNLKFVGGPFSRVGGATVNFDGKLSVTAFTNNCTGTTSFRTGSNLLAGRIAQVSTGTLVFNDGATFTNGLAESVVTPITVTAGTLKAGRAALERFDLDLRGGTLVTESNAGVVYETIQVPRAAFTGGAKIVFDSNPSANECDKIIVAESTGCAFSALNPLKLGLSSSIPATGRPRVYEVLEFPAGVRHLTEADFDISDVVLDAEGDDGTYKVAVRVLHRGNGSQTIVIRRAAAQANTMIMVR